MKSSTTATSIGSIGAALLAHLPCCGPTVLMVFGGAGAGLGWLNALHPYRWAFMAISLATIAFGFYQAYKKPHACHTCGDCANESHAKRRAKIGVMWAIAAISMTLLVVGAINESTHDHSTGVASTAIGSVD